MSYLLYHKANEGHRWSWL